MVTECEAIAVSRKSRVTTMRDICSRSMENHIVGMVVGRGRRKSNEGKGSTRTRTGKSTTEPLYERI